MADLETASVTVTTGILSFITGLVAAFAKTRMTQKNTTTIENQPIDVRLAKEFVKKDEFDAHESQNRKDVGALYDLIREHETRETTFRTGISAQIGMISGKLDMLIEEIHKSGSRK